MVKTDFHTHCLPGMDDGASCPEESLSMLELLKTQGIERVALTSHFFIGKETPEHFAERRKKALEKLEPFFLERNLPMLYPGAEVNIIKGVSEKDLSGLCIGDTNLILLEMPYGQFENWSVREIENIMFGQKLCPVIAHLDRYLAWFSISDFEEILSLGNIIIQINVSAFSSYRSRKFVLNLARAGYPLVIGSDAHNLSSRSPDFSVFNKFFAKKNVRESLEKAFSRSNKILPFEC